MYPLRSFVMLNDWMFMSNQLKWMTNKTLMICFKKPWKYLPGGNDGNKELRIDGFRSEIPTRNFPNTNQRGF
jgi:hypothetical protein